MKRLAERQGAFSLDSETFYVLVLTLDVSNYSVLPSILFQHTYSIYVQDYEKLKAAPCRYTGSPYQNDLVIVAHNYKSHFGNIKNLPAGAEVIYTDAEGTVFQYEVAGLEVIEATDIEGMVESEWALTLFTCTYGGAQRYAVRCNPMIK